MVTKEQMFNDVIARIEFVRNEKGLSYSQFSSSIGVKLTTYYNCIGYQKSKPSLYVVSRVITLFRVNPFWLLYGYGEVFLTWKESEKMCSFSSKQSGYNYEG